MAVAKLDCPECGATLKPAKPLTPGKKVRCPKCDNVFVVPGREDEEEEAPARKTKAAVGRKSPPAEKPAPPPKKKPVDDDDDDGGGVYGLLQEPGAAEHGEGEEESKPKVEYAPEVSIKNPRGPAVAALAVPSNGILGLGALLALIGAMALCVSMWPFLFTKWNSGVLPSEAEKKFQIKKQQDQSSSDRKNTPKRNEEAPSPNEDEVMERIQKSENKDLRKIWEDMVDEDRLTRLLTAGGSVLAIAYFIVMAFAGVKMQNLESPRWSWTASIMAMICVIGLPLGIWFYLENEVERSLLSLIALFLGVIVAGASPFGLWSMTLLKKPEIQEAFRYEPE